MRNTGRGLLHTYYLKMQAYLLFARRCRHRLLIAECLLSSIDSGRRYVLWMKLQRWPQLAGRRKVQRLRGELMQANTVAGLRRNAYLTLLRYCRNSRLERKRGATLMSCTDNDLRRQYWAKLLRNMANRGIMRAERKRRELRNKLLASIRNEIERSVTWHYWIKWRLKTTARAPPEPPDVQTAEKAGRRLIQKQEIRERDFFNRLITRLKKPFGKTGSVGLAFTPDGAVKQIIPGGAAQKAGLQVGDIVVEVRNPTGCHRVSDIDAIMEQIGPVGHVFEGVTIVLRVLRPAKTTVEYIPLRAKAGGKKGRQAPTATAPPTTGGDNGGEEIDMQLTMGPISANSKASRLKALAATQGKVFGKAFSPQKAYELAHDPDACRMMLRGAFNECDTDGSGSLDLEECRGVVTRVAARLGVPEPASDVVAQAMEEADVDQSGELEFEEFFYYLRELFVDIIYEGDAQ